MNIGPRHGAFVAHLQTMATVGAKIQGLGLGAVRPWLACLAACAGTAAALVLAFGGRGALASFGHALITSAPSAVIWMASAAGLGRGLAVPLRIRGSASQTAAGAATLMVLTQWAGTMGVLQLGPIGALLLLAPGWWLLARHLLAPATPEAERWVPALCGVAAGALLAASMVPTGFTWTTEFGGYDALSYHLQVPREWCEMGRMATLPHVAYSGLPGFVEGAFMNLMALRSDPREAALGCQLLHAMLMVVAAWTVGDAVRAAGSARGGSVATLAVMATPWVTVTGSLPYNEAGVLLGCALALRALRHGGPWASGSLAGLALATMVGAKASSLALAAPSALLALAMLGAPMRDARWWLACLAVASVALFPWLLRNAIATASPMFPLLASTLGRGWWSAEQAARWDAAHRSDASAAERALALWRQFLAFGVGVNPVPGEPWRWQWGPLPWLGTAAIAALLGRSTTRRVGLACAMMLAGTVVGWLLCTHLQSRFLMSAIVPLALATGLAWTTLESGRMRRPAVLACAGWALLPAWNLVNDSPQALALAGRVDRASGDLDIELLRSPDDRDVELVASKPMVEAALGTLFDGERVLSVGWSTPFWLPPGTRLKWSSVWDLNPIEAALQQPDPLSWLRERHDLLLIDEGMLSRWQASGWLSPGVRLDRLAEAIRGCEQMRLLGGCRLVALKGPLQPHWPQRRGSGPDGAY
jgi:hypothetical protein